jgi:ATP-dependent Clp protease adapter protein ClpS
MPSPKKKQKSKTSSDEELFSVILHNDDKTTMAFVMVVLTAVFDKSPEDAERITMEVHNQGSGVAGKYPLTTAKMKVSAVQIMARAESFPLRLRIVDKDQKEVGKSEKSATRDNMPSGWIMAGSDPNDYAVEIDKEVFHSGTQCALVTHAVADPQGFGTLMQMFAPDEYLDKRLRLKMWVKTENVERSVQPWFRVDGQKKGEMLGFDNTCNRSTSETTDWKQYTMVLDVPNESTNIAFGIMLMGRGKLWMDDIEFDVVGNDVGVTDCPCNIRKRGAKKAPKNLNFEE